MKSYKQLDDELRALRSEYKANPIEELKEQIYLLDKKLKDIDKSQARYYRPIGNYTPKRMKLKTNVSIKFNSIEEYRDIEKKLIELGYKEGNFLPITGLDKYVYISFRRNFIHVRVCENEKVYSSLQEFLKD